HRSKPSQAKSIGSWAFALASRTPPRQCRNRAAFVVADPRSGNPGGRSDDSKDEWNRAPLLGGFGALRAHRIDRRSRRHGPMAAALAGHSTGRRRTEAGGAGLYADCAAPTPTSDLSRRRQRGPRGLSTADHRRLERGHPSALYRARSTLGTPTRRTRRRIRRAPATRLPRAR